MTANPFVWLISDRLIEDSTAVNYIIAQFGRSAEV